MVFPAIKYSIVIPTHNRPGRLKNCLLSLANLDYPSACYEVIVVDDGSQLSLLPVINEFAGRFPLNFIEQENAGPASARNTGAKAAKGEYLFFTDDDCQPKPDWLKYLAAIINKNPNALIGGCTINALSENVYSVASQLLIDYLYTYYNKIQNKCTFFASNNFAVPRELFDKIGGFDTSFPLAAGEDREFCDRWLQAGYPMQYVPEACINHYHSLNLKSFWRQHFNYGRGAFHFHQVRAHRQDVSLKVEPWSFYWNLLIFPLSQGKGWTALPISLLLLVSQLANGLGFFWEMGRARRHSTRQLSVNSSAQCEAENK